jgi:colanic acid biosynthesis glycosyl transferase WcaI
MAQAVRTLSSDAHARQTLGASARQYALAHLHVDAVLAAAEREFASVVGAKAKPASLKSRTRESDT